MIKYKKSVDISHNAWYNIIKLREGGEQMKEIEKALKDLEKAVKSNEAVASVSVTIRLKKPKPSKAKKT